MLNPRLLSPVLAFIIAAIASLFISFIPSASNFTILIAFLSIFIFGSGLTFFVLDYLIFQEVNKLYDQIKFLKKKRINISPRKVIIEKGNPIELLKTELNSYLTTKEDEVKELKKAHKYRQEFLADVSHELKTPIFSAQGFVHTLLENPDESPEIRQRFLEKAAKSLDGLDELVKDLLTVSQIETGAITIEKEVVDIRKMVLDIFEQLENKAKSRNVTMKTTGYSGEIIVSADPLRIKQVLVNLIENALKYGSDNGKILVEFLEKDKDFQIKIIDNGPGISSEHLPRIFDRFYRVDKSRARQIGGSGLGLSIVKHIVQAHGSKIMVESKIDKGTEFYFRLEKA